MELLTHVREPGCWHGYDDIASSSHHGQGPFFDDVTPETANPGSFPARIGNQSTTAV